MSRRCRRPSSRSTWCRSAGPTGSATGSAGTCRAPTASPNMSSAPPPTCATSPKRPAPFAASTPPRAADVAHQLKNPLTSLRSAIEVAARPTLEPEQRAKLMAIVVQDIERLNRLISDISDASRLDAELMRGEVKTVDLKKLMEDMVQH